MIVVTAVAILLFLAVTFGDFIAFLTASVIWCILPTLLVTCAMYGRYDMRAFSIGALVPWGVLIGMRFPLNTSILLMTIWLLVMSGVCGAVAMVGRRWLQRDADR